MKILKQKQNLVVGSLLLFILFGLYKVYSSSAVQTKNDTQAPAPAPVSPTGNWKSYHHSATGLLGKKYKSFSFNYPNTWTLTTSKNTPALQININEQNVGVFIINPGGHGGAIGKEHRRETIEYPAGKVEINEIVANIDGKEFIWGGYSFMGIPEGAPEQPIFGFESRYDKKYVQEMTPIIDRILSTVTFEEPF